MRLFSQHEIAHGAVYPPRIADFKRLSASWASTTSWRAGAAHLPHASDPALEQTASARRQEAWLTVDMLKSGTRIAGIALRLK